MSSTAVCPVIGSSVSVLPPNHPEYDHNDPEARCPVTNAKVAHHESHIHNHPSSPTVPKSIEQSMDASACPALKSASKKDTVVAEAICPVVGTVSSVLPPSHPNLTEAEAGKQCPVTNATLAHHADKVHVHPRVPQDASAQQCPVVGSA